MKLFLSLIAFVSFISFAQAAETLAEKAEATGKSVVREVKKGVNRAGEAACGTLTGDSKATCLAKKAKNRVVETKDVVVDKVDETKKAIDSK